jgi:hypothetical protein
MQHAGVHYWGSGLIIHLGVSSCCYRSRLCPASGSGELWGICRSAQQGGCSGTSAAHRPQVCTGKALLSSASHRSWSMLQHQADQAELTICDCRTSRGVFATMSPTS